MPFYIVLQFDDDQAAKDFAAKCFKGTAVPNENGDLVPKDSVEQKTLQTLFGFRVFGIWRKPTKFCQCGGGGRGKVAFTRSLGYGWWVCANCSKPTAMWASGARWFTIFGKNLLPRALRIYKDEGDDSMMEWSWLNELVRSDVADTSASAKQASGD